MSITAANQFISSAVNYYCDHNIIIMPICSKPTIVLKKILAMIVGIDKDITGALAI